MMEYKAGSTDLKFDSIPGLASALEHSLEEGRSYGYPVVRVGFDDSEPAWMWLDQLLRERSDWQNGLALAIEQVVGRGDGFVRTAFVDFLANVKRSVALRPLLRRMCSGLDNPAGTRSSFGWGVDADGRPRLEAVLRAQDKWIQEFSDPGYALLLEGTHGPNISCLPLRNPDELRALVLRSIARGRFNQTEWGNGPLAWLHLAVLIRPWVDNELPALAASLFKGSAGERAGAIDWLLDGRDLWRYCDQLSLLCESKPRWLEAPATEKPPGWQRAIRVPRQPPLTTGQVLGILLGRAKSQRDSPPPVSSPK